MDIELELTFFNDLFEKSFMHSFNIGQILLKVDIGKQNIMALKAQSTIIKNLFSLNYKLIFERNLLSFNGINSSGDQLCYQLSFLQTKM